MMSRTISEADWKVFRQVRQIALERFCERVLIDIARLASDIKKSSHERYLAVFKLIEERDEELAGAFNDMRRSTAFFQLARISRNELLTDEEMSRFSPETRAVVQSLLGG
ncbi:MAG: hypothetical protein L0Y72_31990 [Gemmataceae bacterium]|nr:hypothetical protein [Gemmataceae bacterium]